MLTVIRHMHQAAVDLRSRRHFDQIVIYIAIHPTPGGQVQLLRRIDTARHLAIDDHAGHINFTLHPPFTDNPEQGFLIGMGDDISLDQTLDVQITTKPQVTHDHRVT